MAHRIISDDAFLATSLNLFRTYGFEGVSIKRLADATGLEKASLYYRFPGGKDEIAMAVANDVVRWIHAFARIAKESGMSSVAARSRAEEAIVRVEGSLVLSRVLGDTGTFERTIRLLPDLLTVPG